MESLRVLAQLVKSASNNIKYAHLVVKGASFQLLHEMFGTLYDELDGDYDLLAERLIEYEVPPVNQNDVDWTDPLLAPFKSIKLTADTYSDYVTYAYMSVGTVVRAAQKANEEAEGDPGLLNLLGDLIQRYEKWVKFRLTRAYE